MRDVLFLGPVKMHRQPKASYSSSWHTGDRRSTIVASSLLAGAVLAALPAVSSAQLVVDTANGNSPYTPAADATFANITVGNTSTGVVNQSSNTLTSTGAATFGNAAGSTGTYNLTGGTFTISSTGLYLGNNGTGIFNQSGGTFSGAGTDIRAGFNAGNPTATAGSSGAYNLSGGSATVRNVSLGYYNASTMTVTGGTFKSTGSFNVGFRTLGTLTLSGTGVINANDFYCSNQDGTAGSSFTVGGNAVLNVAGQAFLNASSNGTPSSITGGTVNVTGSLQELNGAQYNAVLNISGGNTTLGGYIDTSKSGSSVLNLSGGLVTITSMADLNPGVPSHADFGDAGASTVNQSGGTMAVQVEPILLGGRVAAGAATYNLSGGMLNVVGVAKGAGSGTFNFNGGTLQAGASSTTFMTSLTAANVQAGGAKIDTNGFSVTIAQTLLTGTTGSADGGLTKLGAGTLTLTGPNTYTGATSITSGALATGTTGNLGTGSVSVASVLSMGNATSIADTAALSFIDQAMIMLNATGGSETVLSLLDSTTGKFALPGTYTSAQLNTYFGNSVFSSLNGETLTVVTPEPTSVVFAGLAVGGLAMRRRRALNATA